MDSEFIIISGFVIFILIVLAIDLGLFTSTVKPVSVKQASVMSGVWFGLAICAYLLILNKGDLLHNIKNPGELLQINSRYFHHLRFSSNDFQNNLQAYRKNLAVEFISGYVVEYTLSIDNILVMVLIFTAFGVSANHYRKILLWGIIGAIMMRFCFIFPGAALIARFHWILYAFGAFLVYTGVDMYRKRNEEKEVDAENHRVVKLAAKYLPVFPQFKGDRFFVRLNGQKMITPLFLVLLIIEFTDLIFAVDSVPAVFSITKDPYIVFFSNIFAILGLRSMFFLLVNVIDRFHYLKTGLAALFLFIGLKMLAGDYADRVGLSTVNSLLIILGILTITAGASLLFPRKKAA